MNNTFVLDLEVEEVERKGGPGGGGCTGSSSTNPRCTCPVITIDTQ